MLDGENNINLARKWRCKQFDQLIGQDVSVKIIKNSLYKGYFYPVYLFSGTHGCGKTTMARLFAAAVNCDLLHEFQKAPRNNPLPCLQCASCLMMQEGKHPDFIEIDGASNTGVDNVRSIIDAASFLPVVGRKKIYLIDEAHMLSRAAFNAFLKVLEEPPVSVLFILATTDSEKIIDTVKSRCFELLFKPVYNDVLVEYLHMVCTEENIACDREALSLIAMVSGGCVRDALNLVDQVRMSGPLIHVAMVRNILGYLDNATLLQLIQLIFSGQLVDLIPLLHDIQKKHFSVEKAWYGLVTIVRAIIDIKYGVPLEHCVELRTQLTSIAYNTSVKKLVGALHTFYNAEERLLKTRAQHIFFEVVLIQLCNEMSVVDQKGSVSGINTVHTNIVVNDMHNGDGQEELSGSDEVVGGLDDMGRWTNFLYLLEKAGEALLYSVFSKATGISYTNDNCLEVVLPHELIFSSFVIDEHKLMWEPLLKNNFGDKVKLVPFFTGKYGDIGVVRSSVNQQSLYVKTDDAALCPIGATQFSLPKAINIKNTSDEAGSSNKKLTPIFGGVDFSDVQKWPKTNLVLTCFSGVVEEVDG